MISIRSRRTAHVLGVLHSDAAESLLDSDDRDEFPVRSRNQASGTAYAEFPRITPLGFRLTKASGPREALPSRIEAEPRRDKSPGDLDPRDASALERTGLRYAPSRSFRRKYRSPDAGREMWSTPAQRGCRCAVPSNRFSKVCSPPPLCGALSRRRSPRRRKISRSPGRSMSAGCRGAMPPSPAS